MRTLIAPIRTRAGSSGFALAAGVLLAALCFAPAAAAADEQEVELAAAGQARWPIVVAPSASEETQQAARTLAEYLGRLTGARFAVESGDGATGIAVGRSGDFPGPAAGLPDADRDPTRREDYRLRSHARGLHLIGTTDLAVRHAVWDLLDRLGYRQFFPGPHWEVIPQLPQLRVRVDVDEHPDYLARRIWYGFGTWEDLAGPYADWCARNRATSGVELRTGHAYDGILHRHRDAFAAHPEYLGLVDGRRQSTKFCISNPGLRQLVIDDAWQQFAQDSPPDSVSVDPSDGGGWCECPACGELGSVSDRAVTLANAVAAAIQAKHPGKLVGMYAYNFHSPPPQIRVHPQVVISVATAFLKGGLTLDEILAGWSRQADRLGIREYYSVNTWDRDLPAKARGGRLDYLQQTIPDFHARGVRFLSAESSDNWGPNGLGYYLAARMLWDVGQAQRVDQWVEDFLDRAFGPAKEPMREFYRQLDGSQPHLVLADQYGRMFRALDQARQSVPAGEVRVRIDDLVLYARYVDLYQRYAQAQGEERQQAFETLIRHAYRMHGTALVHTKALYRDLPSRDKSVHVPDDARWNLPEGRNAWKSSEPFREAELAQYLAEGIARYPLARIDFQPVTFSRNLVSAARRNPPQVAPGKLGAGRGRQVFLTRIERPPAAIELQVTGGLIAHYRDRGNVRLELWKLGGQATEPSRTLAASDRSVPPDGQPHTVRWNVKEAGLYELILEDGSDRTAVVCLSDLPWTIRSSLEEPMNAAYGDRWQLYFYVPRGTPVLGVFGGGSGEICDASGRTVLSLEGREPNYWSTPVPAGQDGQFWRIQSGRGPVRLLTVPPYLALQPANLLLPAETVE